MFNPNLAKKASNTPLVVAFKVNCNTPEVYKLETYRAAYAVMAVGSAKLLKIIYAVKASDPGYTEEG